VLARHPLLLVIEPGLFHRRATLQDRACECHPRRGGPRVGEGRELSSSGRA
jgi:hypothetical protein